MRSVREAPSHCAVSAPAITLLFHLIQGFIDICHVGAAILSDLCKRLGSIKLVRLVLLLLDVHQLTCLSLPQATQRILVAAYSVLVDQCLHVRWEVHGLTFSSSR